MYLSVFGEFGREVESHAEFLELDTDGRRAARRPALNNGEWKLAAGQESRLLAGFGEQVGLSKDLQQIPLLQRLERRSHMDIRAEQENVEQVGEGKVRTERLRGACRACGRRLLHAAERWSRELLGRCGADLLRVCAEEVDSQLVQGRPVDLSDLYFKQDLSRGGSGRGFH